MVTTAGPGSFVFKVHDDWAPIGAAHFRKLVEQGHYDDTRFFRVLPTFMVQFGISGDPEVSAVASKDTIQDEPVLKNNKVRRQDKTRLSLAMLAHATLLSSLVATQLTSPALFANPVLPRPRNPPVAQPGYVTFAKTGAPNSRSTQLFVNYVDNSRLDGMGFAPFAEVTPPPPHTHTIVPLKEGANPFHGER